MKFSRYFICVLACLLALGGVGCSRGTTPNEQWDGTRREGKEFVADGVAYTPRTDALVYDFDVTSDPFVAAQLSFAVDLFKGAVALNDYDACTLISPLSVSMALAMTANGAVGQTREQMLALVARNITQDQLNEGMLALRERTLTNMAPLRGYGTHPTVNIANSIWMRESGEVTFNEPFLQINNDYYAADAYERAFDADTVREINAWVNEQTDGLIPSVIDRLGEEDVLCLVNTLLFDGLWADQFSERQIKDATFTAADGSVREVKMLNGTEYYYLDDGRAQGFKKYYEGHEYAFVALLPDEGLTVAEYVAGMDWETTLSMLRDTKTAQGIWCRYQLPKFSIQYNDGGRMDAVLQSLGMTDAYSRDSADLSGIGQMADGEENLYLRRVIHKTDMRLDEYGTTAAAATVEVAPGSPAPIEIRELTFDRPFVCMIVEADTGIPLFMGTVMDVEG